MENSFDPPLLPDTILHNLSDISRHVDHTLQSMINPTQPILYTSMHTDFPPPPSQPNLDATNLTSDSNKPKRKKSRASNVQPLNLTPTLNDP